MLDRVSQATQHVSAETVPIVRRMFADGHAVAQHSGKRWLLLKSPSDLAAMLTTAADRIEPDRGCGSISFVRARE